METTIYSRCVDSGGAGSFLGVSKQGPCSWCILATCSLQHTISHLDFLIECSTMSFVGIKIEALGLGA